MHVILLLVSTSFHIGKDAYEFRKINRLGIYARNRYNTRIHSSNKKSYYLKEVKVDENKLMSMFINIRDKRSSDIKISKLDLEILIGNSYAFLLTRIMF